MVSDDAELERLRRENARLEAEMRRAHALLDDARAGRAGGAGEETRRQLLLLDGVVRHAPIGILVTDPSGVLQSTNQRYRDIFGEDVPGTIQDYSRWTVREVDGSPRDPSSDSAILHALRGSTVTHELRFRRTDGVERWVRITAAPIRDDSERIVGAVALCDDISEDVALLASRDRLLKQVEEERAKLRALLRHLPVAAVVFEAPAFRVELVNDAYEALIGQRGVVGKTLDEIHPGVPAHSILRHLEEVYEHKAPRFRHEHPLQLAGPDGTTEERYFTNTFQPLFDEAGNVRSVVATVQEVTQEVRARRAVAESASRLRVILDELPLGVIVRDGITGDVLLTNRASSDILGIDVMSHGGTDRIGVAAEKGGALLSEDRPHLLVMRTGQPVKNKTLFLRRADTGAEIVLRSSAAPIKGYGDHALVVSVFEDVTDEHRLLEEREETSRFAEKFVGVLGHDLRNPLNAITMGAVLLERRGALDAADARRVQQIASSANRMARMVEQLLEMTRARLGGGIPVDRTSTDLAAVVANAIEELATANPTVEIHHSLPAKAVGMWDEDRLAQVVSNLIGNAIEHGDRARAVTVTLTPDEASRTLTLTVHNHGRAIPDALLPVLFDPFRRGTRDANVKTRGLGLGLYITKEIVLAHGGTVRVTSNASDGTQFTVTLPTLATLSLEPGVKAVKASTQRGGEA
jgi:PAS domain S-box-containing protein